MSKNFTLASTPKVWWPVDVVRAVDGGKTETFRFRAQIEKLSAQDLESIKSGTGEDAGIIRGQIHDWAEVFDGEGNQVPFDDDALDAALDDLDVVDALRNAVMEVSHGRGARKNSRK